MPRGIALVPEESWMKRSREVLSSAGVGAGEAVGAWYGCVGSASCIRAPSKPGEGWGTPRCYCLQCPEHAVEKCPNVFCLPSAGCTQGTQ